MALLSISNLTVAFDDPPLLDGIGLNIERGERVCLIGRNGTGKSTLLKIIADEFDHDSGEIARERGSIIAYLPQEVPNSIDGLVFDLVSEGLAEKGKLLADYHRISSALSKGEGNDKMLLGQLADVQHELEACGAWQAHNEVERVISHMKLDADAECSSLSAGMKRRVLMARALVARPDLLLLDEPTNHLDIETIAWLEEYLLASEITLLFITHDRMFLKKLATRIVELDMGALNNFSCNYETYLKRRDALLESAARDRNRFEKRLADEEAWLRRGVRARRTRNEGRVKALKRMRDEKLSLRQRMGSIHMEAQEANRTGKLVIEAEGISFGYTERPIISDFSTTIMRGDKIGIIGPNGSGKTTLLRILLDDLKPQNGSVRLGTNLQIAYFDQLRSQLDEGKSVQDNICDGNPFIMIDGKQRHVIAYLQDFLFPADRARSPVSILSGGERNRLMLAKLFTLPSNVLVLDEPTNDLDTESLDLLESMLANYGGTVLLVSHDRSFLNNVVTSTIALEGGGRVAEYVGGYDDWVRQSGGKEKTKEKKKPSCEDSNRKKNEGPRKLSFKEKRKLAELPEQIDALEDEKKKLLEALSDPKVYERTGGITETQKRLDEVEKELVIAIDLWAELEERKDI